MGELVIDPFVKSVSQIFPIIKEGFNKLGIRTQAILYSNKNKFWINGNMFHLQHIYEFLEEDDNYSREERKEMVAYCLFPTAKEPEGQVYFKPKNLTDLISNIAHEFGHLSAPRICHKPTEETKAYSFELAFCQRASQLPQLSKLSKLIIDNFMESPDKIKFPAHHEAHSTVVKFWESGHDPYELYKNVIRGL